MMDSFFVLAIPFLLYVGALLYIFLYGINCFLMIFLYRRSRDVMLRKDEEIKRAWNPSKEKLPHVTVQLPIYNERYVVQRLIESIIGLNYP